MAFTVSTIVNAVPGNMRLWAGVVTPDAATGVVTIPGAVSVDAVLGFYPKSALTFTSQCQTMICITPNLGPGATAAAGQIGMTNVITSNANSYFLCVLYH